MFDKFIYYHQLAERLVFGSPITDEQLRQVAKYKTLKTLDNFSFYGN